ncbi:IS66 family transposase, partial [Marinagarivorans algicola]
MENDDLKNKVQSLEAQNKLLKEENDFLREQFNLARHRQFDASCEKASVQPSLFNEPEAELDEPEKVEPQPQESSTTKKSQPKRKPLPKDLPRETRVIDITDEEKV